jgi:hypothetical protein
MNPIFGMVILNSLVLILIEMEVLNKQGVFGRDRDFQCYVGAPPVGFGRLTLHGSEV